MSVQPADLNDPALVTEVELARAAAQEEAGEELVGDHVSFHVEDESAVTHLFEADKPSYHGWRWAVTITSAGPDTDVTVSEAVLLPGPAALVAPDWIPWQNRVQAGDLGVGDLLPTDPDDPRLVPAYLASDDPAVEEVATDVGLGRARVMARPARLDTATRWHQSEFGPRSDMARSAPAHCGTCAFYLPLAGSLRAAFGTCGNEMSPADAHVVHAEYGCGAHSEADVEQVSPVLVADLIYDDAQLDVEPLTVEEPAPAEATLTTEPETTAPVTSDEPAAAAPVDAAVSAPSDTEPPPVSTVEPAPGQVEAVTGQVEAAEPASLEAESPLAELPVSESAPVSAVEPSESVSPDAESAASTGQVEASEPAPLDAKSPLAEPPVSESAPVSAVETSEPVSPGTEPEIAESAVSELQPAEPAASTEHVEASASTPLDAEPATRESVPVSAVETSESDSVGAESEIAEPSVSESVPVSAVETSESALIGTEPEVAASPVSESTSVESAGQVEAAASVPLGTELESAPVSADEPAVAPVPLGSETEPVSETVVEPSAPAVEVAEPTMFGTEPELAEPGAIDDAASATVEGESAAAFESVVEQSAPTDASTSLENEPVSVQPVGTEPEAVGSDEAAPTSDQLVAFPEIGGVAGGEVAEVAEAAEPVALDADQLAAFPEIGPDAARSGDEET